MNFKLSEDISINISITEVFDKIADKLGLPADWRYCFVDNDKLMRNFHEGPYSVEDTITDDSEIIKSFNQLKDLYSKISQLN